MKKNIHPDYVLITVECNCGNKMNIYSTVNQKLNIEICYLCHPYFTGHGKIHENKGRLESFKNKYNFFK